jgi:hypothetical protein
MVYAALVAASGSVLAQSQPAPARPPLFFSEG